MTGGTAKTPKRAPRRQKSPERPVRPTTEGLEAFARNLARVSTTQLCEKAGFKSVNQSALASLSDIMISYICDLGKAAHFYTELSGRTESNAADVILALEDLQAPNGLPAVSDILHKSLSSSSVVRGLIRYAYLADEVPFSKPVPQFPYDKKRAPVVSFKRAGEKPPGHVPDWLPVFPDEHTYKRTAVPVEESEEPSYDESESDSIEQARLRTLARIHQRIAKSGTFTNFSSHKSSPSTSFSSFSNLDSRYSSPKLINDTIFNPSDSQINAPPRGWGEAFFKTPLVPEERPVSAVAVPKGILVWGAKKERNFLNKKEKGSDVTMSDVGIPKNRPSLKFEFGNKSASRSCKEDKLPVWFSRDEENDEDSMQE